DAKPVVSVDAMGDKFASGGWVWSRTDYGANELVIESGFGNPPLCHNSSWISDGLSNTILAGEKSYNKQDQELSWYYDESFFLGGSAGTARKGAGLWRDPADPLLKRGYKDDWGSAHTEAGVHFVFGDGSVRLLPFSTDLVT